MNARASNWLVTGGGLLLLYALLGNYIALPGYIRFLERGSTSAAGNATDLAVVIGATKTILWMFSFQLGVLFLATATAIRNGLPARIFTLGGLAWLVLWAWPTLPQPGAWFYIGFGGALLVAIVLVLTSTGKGVGRDRTSETTMLGALVFFAFATWEVCGLGTTGRMLHPEQAAAPIAHNILITQSTKLMIEFVIAWGLLLASFVMRQGRTAET